MTRTVRWQRTKVLAVLLWVAGACGHEVTIGRYPADAQADAAGGSGGMGGSAGISGNGGNGGSAGHDECAENEPVCGTDGRTYMNHCLAMRAGVFVIHRGPCS